MLVESISTVYSPNASVDEGTTETAFGVEPSPWTIVNTVVEASPLFSAKPAMVPPPLPPPAGALHPP